MFLSFTVPGVLANDEVSKDDIDIDLMKEFLEVLFVWDRNYNGSNYKEEDFRKYVRWNDDVNVKSIGNYFNSNDYIGLVSDFFSKNPSIEFDNLNKKYNLAYVFIDDKFFNGDFDDEMKKFWGEEFNKIRSHNESCYWYSDKNNYYFDKAMIFINKNLPEVYIRKCINVFLLKSIGIHDGLGLIGNKYETALNENFRNPYLTYYDLIAVHFLYEKMEKNYYSKKEILDLINELDEDFVADFFKKLKF